jgi:nucleoid-associated protein YgaU
MGLFSRGDDRKDKPRDDFSSVLGGSSSTAPSRPVGSTSRTPEASRGGKIYVVKEGDSLSRIARREYGDEQQWRRIFEANRDIIDDPDLIHPGQQLRIP